MKTNWSQTLKQIRTNPLTQANSLVNKNALSGSTKHRIIMYEFLVAMAEQVVSASERIQESL